MKTKIFVTVVIVSLFLVLRTLAQPGRETNAKPKAGNAVESLRAALILEDSEAIRAAVQPARAALGDAAGIPEEADKYVPVPKSAKLLTPSEAQHGMAPHMKRTTVH